MEEKKKSNIGLIVFLIILILGLAGYICYDNFFATNNDQNNDIKCKKDTCNCFEKEKESSDVYSMYSVPMEKYNESDKYGNEYNIKDTNITIKRYYNEPDDIYKSEVYISNKKVIDEYANVFISSLNNNYIFYIQGQSEGDITIVGYSKTGESIFKLDSNQIGACNRLEVEDNGVSVYKIYSNEGAGVCPPEGKYNKCSSFATVKQELIFNENKYKLVDTDEYECD